jgi:hypothetical protein
MVKAVPNWEYDEPSEFPMDEQKVLKAKGRQRLTKYI